MNLNIFKILFGKSDDYRLNNLYIAKDEFGRYQMYDDNFWLQDHGGGVKTYKLDPNSKESKFHIKYMKLKHEEFLKRKSRSVR